MSLFIGLALAIISYIIGAVPTAYIAGRIRNVDITKLGSKNVGTLNAWKHLGWKAGLVVLIFDTLKGALVMGIILFLGLNELTAFVLAVAVTIGHNFSIFLGLRGGRGVAVAFGLSLVVLPVFTLITLGIIAAAYLISRSLVFSFGLGFLSLNILSIFSNQSAVQVGICVALTLIIGLTHLWRTRVKLFEALCTRDLRLYSRVE